MLGHTEKTNPAKIQAGTLKTIAHAGERPGLGNQPGEIHRTGGGDTKEENDDHDDPARER